VVESLKWALSWLAVLAVGLAPMLVYWLAGVIGQAIRRKALRRLAGSAPIQREEGQRAPQDDEAPPDGVKIALISAPISHWSFRDPP